ncbi:NUDIX domain-containing protein [Pontibacillus yanchengensis]|uniref:NUDIX domain-containing protein n=2 Tax=Pontibacillus yanchengensis TaxID=462910 RepID=A0ACC7VIY2_9BACI|nr:8-oxo-dGTP diphosphatase [Pontibacillus yanchengensis]MYL34035.1 NUDIX domain-containing protein [Pontibacillus yanchengensis]MYL54085.1 NUDIX domain-containing protein [Pontibacillus yanchengensis]
MQRVTNCIVKDPTTNQVLMLKKPRRGWYVAPGGKMEPGEHIRESVIREYKEETGLTLQQPRLNGVFSFVIKDGNHTVQEWMMFTFYCENVTGDLLSTSPEGELEWVDLAEVLQKPMAEGDRRYYKHILSSNEVLYGTFTYTTDFTLLDVTLDPASP